MATIEYHHTEDDAATVTGRHGSVIVVDQGNGYIEVMEKRHGRLVNIANIKTYQDATCFAKLYVDQPR